MAFDLESYGPMDGRTVVITGATRGIGLEAARALSEAGAELVIVSRHPERTRTTAEEIAAQTGRPVHAISADFGDLSQVRAAAAEVTTRFGRIDVLANNAGAIYSTRQVTADGFEMTLQVDHLAPFLFTSLLEPALAATPGSRVITVSSAAHFAAWRGLDFDDLNHERRWSSFGAYSAAKLANIMFSAELAQRWDRFGVTSNALHPGMVRTGFGRGEGWGEKSAWAPTNPWAVSSAEGADTLVYLASSADVVGVTGRYFSKRTAKKPSRPARNEDAQRLLWTRSAEMLGLAALSDDTTP